MYYADSDCPVMSLTMLTDGYTILKYSQLKKKLITKFNLETLIVYLLEINITTNFLLITDKKINISIKHLNFPEHLSSSPMDDWNLVYVIYI